MSGIIPIETAILDELQRAYSHASPTDELITGRYAKEFAGPVKWSRAFDFGKEEAEGCGFSGLRYIDFVDCTNVYAMKYSDGEAVNIYALGTDDLRKLSRAMRGAIGARMKPRVNRQPRRNKGGASKREGAKATYRKLSSVPAPEKRGIKR